MKDYSRNVNFVNYQVKNISQFFSDRLRQLRGDTPKTVFARKIGVSNPSTYHNYEAGRVPKLEILQRIADLHGVTVDWLTGGGAVNFDTQGPCVREKPPEKYAAPQPKIQEILQEQARISAQIGVLKKRFEDLAVESVNLLFHNGESRELNEAEVEDIKRRAAARAAARAAVKREGENKQNGGAE